MFSSYLIFFNASYSYILKFIFINFFSLRFLIFYAFFIFDNIIVFFISFYNYRGIELIVLNINASFINSFKYTSINLNFSIWFFCSYNACSFWNNLFEDFHLFFLGKYTCIKTLFLIIYWKSLNTLSIFLHCVFFIYCFSIFYNLQFILLKPSLFNWSKLFFILNLLKVKHLLKFFVFTSLSSR